MIETTTVYVTDVIIVEVVYVLEKVYELPRKDIYTLIVDFLNFSHVVHNPRFLLQAIELYKRHSSLSIVDCYASEEAKSFGNDLVTLDKRLLSQAGTHIRKLV